MKDFDTGHIANSDFDLGQMGMSGASGMDAMLHREAHILTPHKGRKKVASLSDLSGFTRVSAETLIHKSDKDLWTIQKEADGAFYIQRLFDDNGEPLKG